MEKKNLPCPDCGPELSRRDFVKNTAGAAVAASLGGASILSASERRSELKPEDLVRKFYDSLTAEQKKVVALPWDSPKRTRVSNNWRIVDIKNNKFFNAEQQRFIKDIFRGLVSEDGWDRFQKSMKDDYGGIGNYCCCIFGNPAEGKYEWVFTGRHLTIRCDGNRTPNVAFGGPIFYGHAVEFDEKPDHPGNVWWHQARLANKIFGSLDGKQRDKALLKTSPPDSARSIEIKSEGFTGLPVAGLSKDQKALVEQCMRELLAPYRASDVEEAMKYITAGGGTDKIHLSFYRDGDLGKDSVWDRWMVQSPALSWYFRGSPHVHTWVNIAAPRA